MGERGFAVKADIHKQTWDRDEFPMVCESCLGDNPYVRMMKETYGAACKVCQRPYTVFRWKPGRKAKYKRTEICHTCARMKNVCQTCVLDLQYGLPVEVRDAFLTADEKQSVAQSDPNREFASQQHARQLENEETGYGKAPNRSLLRLARNEPYYKRNRAHLCSFFAKGECQRGDECPYIHELPKRDDDPLNSQNLQNRFFGTNDAVAAKILDSEESKTSHETAVETETKE